MPETTPRGYPVPLLADAIDDGVGHLDAFWDLALAIDTDISATVVDQLSATVTVTGDVAEHDLYRKTIPGGALGADGVLQLVLGGDFLPVANNVAINYRFRAKYGATTLLDTGTQTDMLALGARGKFLIGIDLFAAGTGAQRMLGRKLSASSGSADSWQALSGNARDTTATIGYGVATEDSTVAKDLAVTVVLDAAGSDIRRHMALLTKVS